MKWFLKIIIIVKIEFSWIIILNVLVIGDENNFLEFNYRLFIIIICLVDEIGVNFVKFFIIFKMIVIIIFYIKLCILFFF